MNEDGIFFEGVLRRRQKFSFSIFWSGFFTFLEKCSMMNLTSV